jgi:PAS domain S-box-containing protein
MLQTTIQSDAYFAMPKTFRAIHELALALLGKTKLEEIAWLITSKAIKELDLEDCVVYLLDPQRQTLKQVAAYGPKNHDNHVVLEAIEIPLGQGIVGKAALLQQTILVQDTRLNSDYIVDDQMRLSELAVPIIFEDQVIGVIDSEHHALDFYTEAHVEVLEAIARLVAEQLKSCVDIQRYMDFSEHERMEMALKESEKRFKLAVSGTSAGVWDWKNMLDDKQWWSKQFYKLLGYNQHEIEASLRHFEALLHPDDLQKVMQTIDLDVHCKDKIEVEYRLRLKNGTYRWFLGNAVVVKDLYGRPNRMVGTIIDINDRKIAEKELEIKQLRLETQNRELEQFAFIASHDLQEPLRTISSFVQLLQRKCAPQLDSDGQKYMLYIEQSTGRMRDLINGLLDYARISKGKEQEMSQVDLNLLIPEVLADMHSSISDSGVQITVEQMPKIKAYPTELRLLFQNLISNAIKFKDNARSPEIKIEVSALQHAWQFSVKDNGIGIEAQQFDKIFDLFKRLHNRHEYEGTGIGLAHCKKIVALHGGRIWLESTLGQGSTFYFTIPIL